MGTPKKKSAESFVKDIRNNTRRIFTAEQKILIVMEALRAEISIAELCRKYSINQSQFYKWNKEFLEAGKKRLSGDVTREATSDEVTELKKENARLKEMVADLVLRYDIVKKSGHDGLADSLKRYMRLTATEKHEIIQQVTRSELGVKRTLEAYGISRSTFYKWYQNYLEKGFDGLKPKQRLTNRQWNSIPDNQKDLVVELALDHPELSSRELAFKITDEQAIYISESSVYRILKQRGLIAAPNHILIAASNEFKDKTQFVHQMWQTDFTYFKIIGWGWYYLSTILDDYSRYIIHWELCDSMKAEDVKRTVNTAIAKARLKTKHKPKLLSDNGPCYVSNELKTYLKDQLKMKQVHGKPMHPQTQGKIERYHRTMKNVVKLNHFYHPEELIQALNEFVENYNNKRYHESLNNLTPADVYYGRSDKILEQRAIIKQKTIAKRRQLYNQEKILNL
ncbi:IS3 family transposase [Paenimyroides viscosum]|uniref:IS3 family transposase n=1 Tax=Paenimyroides viscosum TaxID=2488729 RepID=UPI0037CB6D85